MTIMEKSVWLVNKLIIKNMINDFKKVMKDIRKRRELTAMGMSMLLGITPSYLSRIENKGNIPVWFMDKMITVFKLDTNEIYALKNVLENLYYNLNDPVGMKTKVMSLKKNCIIKLYALVGSILAGTTDESKETHVEIINILNEMRKFYDNNQTLI